MSVHWFAQFRSGTILKKSLLDSGPSPFLWKMFYTSIISEIPDIQHFQICPCPLKYKKPPCLTMMMYLRKRNVFFNFKEGSHFVDLNKL